MSKTSWPFVEWTQTVGKKDVERLYVIEEVLVGKKKPNILKT